MNAPTLNETLQHVTSMYDTATTRAERAEAELALLKPKYEKHCREYNDRLSELRYAENMQRSAEADLAAERARLDWLLEDNVTRFDVSYHDRAAINAAMKEILEKQKK